MINTIS